MVMDMVGFKRAAGADLTPAKAGRMPSPLRAKSPAAFPAPAAAGVPCIAIVGDLAKHESMYDLA